ncbi:MAG: Trigger factor [Verrucomicrobiales bacterium]|nr:Trigger factor [Verrucomicrobiales bacterium]
MNVTVENLAPCKKLVRVEIDSQKVDEAFDSMTKEYQRQVTLPGFRQGKAPRDMVVKKFGADIKDEVKKKLIPDAYRQAVSDQKLNVIGYPDIEEIQFAKGQSLQFAATIETAPEFELPEYKGLPVQKESKIVTEEDVEKAIQVLRERQAKYETVTRPVQEGDIAVVNYTGTCEGKPITDFSTAAKGLTTQKNFWINVEKDSFIPGFGQQLIGLKTGDSKNVEIDFPQDFVTPEVAGKKGSYQTEIVEVKEKILTPVDEEFAKSFGAESLDKLREGIRRDLENELTFKQTRDSRQKLAETLLNRVNCELPEGIVLQETKNVIYNIVQENQQRGVSTEIIDQSREQIYSAANTTAKDRVKLSFIFGKIAEKEGIKVTQDAVLRRVTAMAQNYGMTPDKLVKELQKRDGFGEIYEQLLNEKVLDFLAENAKVEEVSAEPAKA